VLLGRIPVGNGGGSSVLRGGRRSNAVRRRGECGRVCSGIGFTEEREKSREREGHGYALDSGGEVAAGEHFGSSVARVREVTGEALRRQPEVE
jgi:hypothetical protein